MHQRKSEQGEADGASRKMKNRRRRADLSPRAHCHFCKKTIHRSCLMEHRSNSPHNRSRQVSALPVAFK
jgi:hypothetical protein